MAFPVTDNIAKSSRHTTFYVSCGAEDAPLIWAATHRPAKDAMTRNWYAGPSLGWLATVRLTNHLATPQ